MDFNELNISAPNSTVLGVGSVQPNTGPVQAQVVDNVCGVIIPGRALLYQWEQIDVGRLVVDVAQPHGVDEITFFLLPNSALAPDKALGLYYSTSPYQSWTILGFISAAKPSVILSTSWRHLAGVKTQASIRLGVSIESPDAMANLEQKRSASHDAERGNFGVKLAEDLYRYLVSFSQTTAGKAPYFCVSYGN